MPDVKISGLPAASAAAAANEFEINEAGTSKKVTGTQIKTFAAADSLPLAGGTLTGALAGTSISMSGNATVGSLNAVSGIQANAGNIAAASGDLVSHRSAAAGHGLVFLGNSGVRYLHFNGDSYLLNGTNLHVPFIRGGAGDAGTLKTWNNANTVNFHWVGGNDGLRYRVDEALERAISWNTNATGMRYESGLGGPTNIGLVGLDHDGNTWVSYVDFGSDERLKTNIAPTVVDAVDTLRQIDVVGYSVRSEVAAWYAAVGQDNDTSARLMQDAVEVPVAIGFHAQQLKEIVPDAVSVVPQTPGISPLPTDLFTINAHALAPYLVRAIQQQAAQIDALRGEVAALKVAAA